MTKDVDQLVEELIGREGGYSDHPADKGGPTMYGITEHEARANNYSGPMRQLTKTLAVSIYKHKYWTTPNFDIVAVRYPKVAAELFDTGVNMGPMRASKFLQRALNVLNRGTIDYPDIHVDGQIGPMTIYALDHYRERRSDLGERVLVRLLESQQADCYMDIAESDPTQETFMFGWILNRIGDA